MTTALATLTSNLATRLGMDDGAGLTDTLKATAFKGQNVTDSQMTALLIVANQFGLNPWTKEIYAFPDKGGIVPVVGVDGWARIINTNDKFDGMDFETTADSCTCIIFRKDRSHPIKVTEYLDECKRTTQPWQSHPKRMLRHKAMIQCARLAFGFGGIYDQDEAERILESDGSPAKNGRPTPAAAAASNAPTDGFDEYEAEHIDRMRAAAMEGTEALTAAFKALPVSPNKLPFWQKNSAALKAAAAKADADAPAVIDHETGEVMA